MNMFLGFSRVTVVTLAVAAAAFAQTAITENGAERAALAQFDAAVGEYLKAHRFHDPIDLETLCLPGSSIAASAALLDQPPAPQEGGLFTPAITAMIRARLAGLGLPTSSRQPRRNAIVVGDPVAPGRTARVPRAILTVLPRVPADLDYRLAGADLLLVDLRTSMVIDALRDWRTVPHQKSFPAEGNTSQSARPERTAQPVTHVKADGRARHTACSTTGQGEDSMRPAEHVEATRPDYDQSLQVRIQAEFREMPGLKLTIPQASRLFALDSARCEQVLSLLVGRGVLAAAGGTFMRADSGRRHS